MANGNRINTYRKRQGTLVKNLMLLISLILIANTVAATSLSIKRNKDLPTPYELITKGTILDKFKAEKSSALIYWIAWDKTDDIYLCHLSTRISERVRYADSTSDCYLTIQQTNPEEGDEK